MARDGGVSAPRCARSILAARGRKPSSAERAAHGCGNWQPMAGYQLARGGILLRFRRLFLNLINRLLFTFCFIKINVEVLEWCRHDSHFASFFFFSRSTTFATAGLHSSVRFGIGGALMAARRPYLERQYDSCIIPCLISHTTALLLLRPAILVLVVRIGESFMPFAIELLAGRFFASLHYYFTTLRLRPS